MTKKNKTKKTALIILGRTSVCRSVAPLPGMFLKLFSRSLYLPTLPQLQISFIFCGGELSRFQSRSHPQVSLRQINFFFLKAFPNEKRRRKGKKTYSFFDLSWRLVRADISSRAALLKLFEALCNSYGSPFLSAPPALQRRDL